MPLIFMPNPYRLQRLLLKVLRSLLKDLSGDALNQLLACSLPYRTSFYRHVRQAYTSARASCLQYP